MWILGSIKSGGDRGVQTQSCSPAIQAPVTSKPGEAPTSATPFRGPERGYEPILLTGDGHPAYGSAELDATAVAQISRLPAPPEASSRSRLGKTSARQQSHSESHSTRPRMAWRASPRASSKPAPPSNASSPGDHLPDEHHAPPFEETGSGARSPIRWPESIHKDAESPPQDSVLTKHSTPVQPLTVQHRTKTNNSFIAPTSPHIHHHA